MNILITSIVDLNKSQHNRPHQLVKYLSKRHNITVLSINDWWKGDQDNLKLYSKDFDDIFNRVDYRHLTNKKISPIIQEIFSNNKVNNLIKEKKFDIHLNYSTLVSGYFAAKKLKTIYDIADDLGAMVKESPQIPFFLRPAAGIFGDFMVKKNVSICDKVTLTTENLRRTYGISENKSEVISNGVDTNLFKDYGSKTKEELGLNGFILGYVGVLREWIDFEPIFSILNELDNEIKIVIVGKEGRFKETIALAKNHGLENRVKFTGMRPYSQIPRYISAMDVCLIPFKKGAISESAVPLKLFEYMACKKPIISTRLSGIEKISNDKILYASNRDEYKDKIITLFEDNALRKKMGIIGRKFVEENYEWEKIAGKMEKILLNLNDN